MHEQPPSAVLHNYTLSYAEFRAPRVLAGCWQMAQRSMWKDGAPGHRCACEAAANAAIAADGIPMTPSSCVAELGRFVTRAKLVQRSTLGQGRVNRIASTWYVVLEVD